MGEDSAVAVSAGLSAVFLGARSLGTGDPAWMSSCLHAEDFLYSIGSSPLGPRAAGSAPFFSSSVIMISFEAWCRGAQLSALRELTLAPCCTSSATTSVRFSCAWHVMQIGDVMQSSANLDGHVEGSLALGVGRVDGHAGPDEHGDDGGLAVGGGQMQCSGALGVE